MIRIAVLGDIGSGKSYVANKLGYPVFNADKEVAQLYRKSAKCYNKLKKTLPKYINRFPVNKNKLSEAIIADQKNLKKIVKIIHPEIRSKMNSFIKRNKNKKIIIAVGNAVNSEILLNQKMDVYYINSISKNMNFDFIKKYKKVIIIEPYFGSILERKIRKKNFLDTKILSIGYNETIIHKYGDKIVQDKYLKFCKESILKKINEFK